MSPRTRCEEVIEYILSELKKKNLKALNVYKMADLKNAGGVQAMILEINFKKILPHLRNEVFQEAFQAFKITNQRDIITRQDFDTVFNDTVATASYVPNSSGIQQKKVINTTAATNELSSKPKSTEEDHIMWLKKLDNAMLREGISPSVAFKAADLNHNGVVSVEELRDSIKRLVPEGQMSLVELNKVMMAFDTNKNGTVEESEFISLIEKARNSTVTIIETTQKSRMIGD